MKKQLLKFFIACLVLTATGVQSQCLEATGGLYPDDVFEPICAGEPVAIVIDGFAGEYSLVQLTDGIEYTFLSSVATDYLTIGDEEGTIVLASGTGSVIYTPTASTIVRFYTHTDSDCGEEDLSRRRSVQCGTPVSCNPTVPYAIGFEPGQGYSCLTYQDVNGGEASGWMVINDNDIPTDYGNYSMLYTYDSLLPGDDWFFTPGLPLTGAQEYTLSFKYRGGIGGSEAEYVENLEVKYGSTATAAGMTQPLLNITDIDTNFGDPFSTGTITITPATSGTYYIGFRSFSIADQGYIQIDDLTLTTSLGTDTVNKSAFISYPNPVKNKWDFSYDENINEIVVLNMLGQKVFTQSINATSGSVDFSALASGAYIVKVQIGQAVKTVRIIKE